MMQDPQFVDDLANRLESESPLVGELPRKVLKKKVPNFLKKGIVRSLFLHLIVVMIFPIYQLVSGVLGWEDEREARRRAMEMARTAIRVDMVDLPSLTLRELQKVDLTQPVDTRPKEEPKAQEEVKVSETAMIDRTKKAEAEKKKKAELAAERKKREAEQARKKEAEQRVKDLQERLRADQRRQELVDKLKQGGGRQAVAGNIVSDGYSTTGDVATEADAYHGLARAHVQRHWHVPGWMTASNLSAVVLVKIAPDGRVISKEFLKRSGNSEFDGYVQRAIEMANPLPAPPDSLKRTYMEDGIEWGFPR